MNLPQLLLKFKIFVLKLFQTTSPRKLFPSDCMTLSCRILAGGHRRSGREPADGAALGRRQPQDGPRQAGASQSQAIFECNILKNIHVLVQKKIGFNFAIFVQDVQQAIILGEMFS